MNHITPTIFVIDDDDVVRDSVTVLLETRHYAVTAFSSADAFLRRDHGAAGDCMILDLHMPGMTGLDLLKQLRQSGDAMPAILITGRFDSSVQAEARKLGVTLLEKPISPQLLFAAIKDAMEARTSRPPALSEAARESGNERSSRRPG